MNHARHDALNEYGQERAEHLHKLVKTYPELDFRTTLALHGENSPNLRQRVLHIWSRIRRANDLSRFGVGYRW